MTTHPASPSTTLRTDAARLLATTTKTPPHMQGITSRWLLKILPWVETTGGTFRVNRRLTHTLGDGRIEFVNTGAEVEVIPAELREIPLLRGLTDTSALRALADRCEQREYAVGETLNTSGAPVEELLLIAHGKVRRVGRGKYGDEVAIDTLADGDYIGDQALTPDPGTWEYTVRAVTRCTVLALPRAAFTEVSERLTSLREHLTGFLSRAIPRQNRRGEAEIELASGHSGEPTLPGTFADYDMAPREYELGVAQTVLRVHSRVADLFNDPMNQVQEQLRLTVEALRERQEYDMVNDRAFGLLHNADLKQRLRTRGGPPTPDDLDELLSRRRRTQYLLAHPRAIAAVGRELSRCGIYPPETELQGTRVRTWRGVPLLPCDKIPITQGTSSILALRTGQEHQGVVGLHQTGIPDEVQAGLNARFMGVDDQARMAYLVSAYFSVAVLVPDALGVLEDVEV